MGCSVRLSGNMQSSYDLVKGEERSDAEVCRSPPANYFSNSFFKFPKLLQKNKSNLVKVFKKRKQALISWCEDKARACQRLLNHLKLGRKKTAERTNSIIVLTGAKEQWV